ncbi:hypothetical protein REPUB_Repub05bG0047600 [Reevesia pubescens]
MFALNPLGVMLHFMWNERNNDWEILTSSQADQCAIYAFCGAYATCTTNKSPPCACVEGFVPSSTTSRDSSSVNWSDGCIRRTSLGCDGKDSFFKHIGLKFPDTSNSWANKSMNLQECEELCLRKCSCTAYANLDILKDRIQRKWKSKEKLKAVVISISIVLATGLMILVFVLYVLKKKLRKRDEEEEMELPMIDFTIIANATNNFSNNNQLGRGGFGLVYKHRNLVKLFGCCIKEEERMLIYEYMSNKSLDYFIFDKARSEVLHWRMRMHIVDGIARGILYLHHDSRLRIIHRDLKPSNILLDNSMNPKISDFGLDRKFGADQTEAKTKRVVGTYGYMSPEYAFEGHFSPKSDIFSFGVLVLEIVTGKRN